MKALQTVLLAALLALTGCTTKYPLDYDGEAMQWIQTHVWKITSGNNTGSGFWVDNDTMLTACHVVSSHWQSAEKNPETGVLEWTDHYRIAETVNVRDDWGMYIENLDVLYCDFEQDIAILKRQEIRSEFAVDPLSVYTGWTPVGKRLYAGGYPVGMSLTLTQGYWQGPVQIPSWNTYHRVSTLTIFGDSGSPLLAYIDGSLQIVGIRQAVRVIEQGAQNHLTFATDGALIQDHINKYDI